MIFQCKSPYGTETGSAPVGVRTLRWIDDGPVGKLECGDFFIDTKNQRKISTSGNAKCEEYLQQNDEQDIYRNHSSI